LIQGAHKNQAVFFHSNRSDKSRDLVRPTLSEFGVFEGTEKCVKRVFLITITALVILLSGLSCSAPGGTKETVTVAQAQFESIALLYIAQDQQFFTQNGLDTASQEYDTGAGALDSVLKGEADIAVGTSEFPLVIRAFNKEEIRVIGAIDRAEFIYLIGRKDHGIAEVSDLKGKKVGTASGTIAEFYLGRFLNLHGMSMQDIRLVNLKTPAEWMNAIADGDVEAVAVAQPHARLIQGQLGPNAVVWPVQSNQSLYTLLIAREGWIAQHPEAIRRFLKGLAQAEDYLLSNPDQAKGIVQRQLNLDAGYMETVWRQNQFSLFLDQSLILAMEDEARWMINNRLTTQTQVPNFMDYIDEDGLKVVKPEAVNILR
jgi:ABC-type nitrate/sulfonate/bicarbonate transport system substrate-binding protein